ncbi:hypothetical protein N7475_010196, partial [Penicillium sp. IBT 31633x]
SATVLIMAWPTRNTPNIPAHYPWTYAELENWRAEYFKQPEPLLMTPSPDPSASARTPTGRLHSYNYQMQLPTTPIGLGAMLSPTPSSSYLDPGAIKRPINHQSLRSVPHQDPGAMHSPASLSDPRCLSPWMELPTSPPVMREMPRQDEASKESSQAKRGCRSRRRGPKKKDGEDYGTFKCEWKGCTYDRMFSRKGVLMRHIETQHVSPRGFKCPSCEHASSRRENLKAHRQSIHKEVL